MIKRELFEITQSKLFQGKAIIILGGRQSGKSTFVREVLGRQSLPGLILNCDEPAVKASLEDISTAKWRQLIGDHKILEDFIG
jgi:uncharacterized protein